MVTVSVTIYEYQHCGRKASQCLDLTLSITKVHSHSCRVSSTLHAVAISALAAYLVLWTDTFSDNPSKPEVQHAAPRLLQICLLVVFVDAPPSKAANLYLTAL